MLSSSIFRVPFYKLFANYGYVCVIKRDYLFCIQAGGLDMLTLDSLYDDALRRNNQNVSYNPWEQAPAGGMMQPTMHDPFFASNRMAAPPSVQMAAMSNQQQSFMYQQQQQMMMMPPQQPSGNPFGNAYGAAVHPYGTGMPVQSYNPYTGLI